MADPQADQTSSPIDSSSHNLVHIPGVGVVGFPKSVPMDMQEDFAGKMYDSANRFASGAGDSLGVTSAVSHARRKTAEDEAVRQAVVEHATKGEYTQATKLALAHLGNRAVESQTESPAVQALKSQAGQISKAFAGKTLAEKLGQGAAAALPLVGPAAASFGENVGTKIGQGDYAGAAGAAAGAATPFVVSPLAGEAGAGEAGAGEAGAGEAGAGEAGAGEAPEAPVSVAPKVAPRVAPRVVKQAPASAEQIVARAYLHRLRALDEPTGVETTAIDPITGVNISGKVTGDKSSTTVASPEEVKAFIKKQFGDRAPEVTVGETPEPMEPLSTAEKADLSSWIARQEAKKDPVSKTEADIAALATIRKRLGLNKIDKPDPATAGKRPTAEDISRLQMRLSNIDKGGGIQIGGEQVADGQSTRPIIKNGEIVGKAVYTIDKSGTADIKWIGEPKGGSVLSNKLGQSDIRQLMQQMKVQHPAIKQFSGVRIGGARGGEALSKTAPAPSGSPSLSRESIARLTSRFSRAK